LLHGRIATTLEVQFPEIVETQPEVLGLAFSFSLNFCAYGAADRHEPRPPLARPRQAHRSAVFLSRSGDLRDQINDVSLRVTTALDIAVCGGQA
jgi:hypothetical protein